MLATNMFDPTGLSLGLVILRVIIGFTMFAHGFNHVWRGGKIEGTGRWFESLGMKPGKLHAWLASITELVCGPMLILGLLNPLAAAGIVGVMAVAFMTNHRPNGFFIFRPGEGYEYVLNLLCAGLALGAMGPGEWSVDNVLGLETSGWLGFGITVVAGLGGAVALLAVFWRPEPKAAEEAS